MAVSLVCVLGAIVGVWWKYRNINDSEVPTLYPRILRGISYEPIKETDTADTNVEMEEFSELLEPPKW